MRGIRSPDDTFGELPAAAVVMSGTVSPDDIVEACGDRIARHKRPRRVEIMDALPKSPAGKVLRTELRRLFG